ncbi:restriction endonuclease subunit S [Marinomonas ostreistagni]|uniref:restriction endonuclease subunit S n=1 Tax=Marinomonas ostreistagni TaxID=359209 RepID=UPI00194DDBAC|nr:restriction endonuclease subunit S [Marinomonas ostreistagni]MBM6550381.1 restriction endonuclease subunit S [Marinomonas ostreistagni]
MSDTPIPKEWLKVKLTAVADLNMGQSPSSADVNETGDGIVFFQGKADFGKLFPTARKYCSAPKKIAQENDILLSVRAPVGPTNLADRETAIGRGLAAISVSKENFSYKYLLQFFRHIQPWLSEQGTGTTFKAISGQFLRELDCIISPLAEQKVIVDKLDSMLAQVETTKARLERIPEILKTFRQSVLASAVSGKLTEEWRGGEPIEWDEKNLEDVSKYIVDCPHSTPKWSEDGVLCVRTTAFKPFQLILSNQGFVSEQVYKERIQRLEPREGDILYSREGTVGIACQIPKDVQLCLGQRMVLIRSDDTVDAKYLTIVLNSELILKIVKAKTIGSTVPRVNMKDIRSYPVPLPSLSEQRAIIRRVEELFAFAESVEEKANAALERVNKLTQSILAKAFRGELTADWRAEHPDLISGENSAEALLERIKAERAALSKKTTKKKSANT